MVVETKDSQKLMAICTDIISKTHDWIWEVDLDGFFTFCSEDVEDFLGYTPLELYKKNVYEYLPPANVEKLGRITDIAVPFLHKDGRIVNTNINAIPFFDENDEFQGYRGMSKAITEERIDIKFSKTSDHVSQLISENMNDLICIIGENNYKIEYINGNKFLKSLGYTYQNLIGQRVLDLINPKDHGKLGKLLKSGKSLTIDTKEIQIKNSNGSYIWAEIRSIKYKDKDSEKKILLILKDITTQKNLIEESEEFKKKIREISDSVPEIKYWKLLQPKKEIAEQLFHESEKKYKNIINHLDVGFFKSDITGIILTHNPTLNKIFGYDLNQNLVDLSGSVLWSDKEDFDKQIKTLIKTGTTRNFTQKTKKKNGEIIYINVYSHLVYDKDGNPIEIEGTITDITEKFTLEQKLKESEKKYRTIIENTKDIIVIVGLDGNYNYISPQFTKALGGLEITKEEDFFYHVHPDDRMELINLFKGALKNKTVTKQDEVEFRIKHQKGHYLWFASMSKNYLDENGNVAGFISNLRDITERKVTEQKLAESELKYQTILENSKDGIAIIGLDGKFKYLTPSLGKMLGMEEYDKNTRLFENIHLDDIGHLRKAFLQAVKQKNILGDIHVDIEYRALHKDGHYIWISSSTKNYNDGEGKVIGFISNLRDITDKKLAEEKLKESEKRYRNIIENTADAITIIGLDGKIKFVSHQLSSILGKKINEQDNFFKHIHPDDIKVLTEAYSKVFKQRELHKEEEIIFRLEHVDGHYVWLYSSTKNYYDDEGNVIGFISALRDITKRRITELKLEEKMREMETFINNIPHLAWLKDLESNFILVNKAFGNTVGLDPEYLINNTCAVCFGEDAAKGFKEADREVIEGKNQITFYESIADKDGKQLYLETTKSPIFNDKGEVTGTVGIAIDITERKIAEQQLKESEVRFRRMIENSSDVLSIMGLDGKILYQSPSCENVFGFKPIEMVDTNAYDHMHPEDRTNVINVLAEGLRLGLKTGRVECRFRHKDGSWKHIEAIGSNLLEYKGIQSIIINTRDNTERKKIEQKLIESEEKYRSITNNITDVIAELDLEGNFKYISPQSYDVVGYRPEELIGNKNSDYVHPDDLVYLTEAFKESIQSKQINTLEFRTHHKDGYYVPVSIRSTLVDVEGEKKVFAVLRDITERKKAEQQLKESEEKFRNIAEQSLMGIAILQDNMFKYANKKYAELGGYELEELRDWTLKDYLQFIYPDDRLLVTEQAKKKQHGDSDIINTYQFRATKKSGEIIWLEIFSSNITYNGRPADLITAIDVTEKKYAEQKIKESEEKYRLISENANDLIAIINKEFRYEYVNEETYYRVTGFSKEELIGKVPFLLAHEEDKELAIKSIEEAFITGEGMTTLRFQNKNGEYMWLEVKGRTFIDKEQEEKMLVIARDITQRKEAELQVYEFNKLLESIIEERTKELRESEKRLQKKTDEQALLLDNIETQIWYLKDVETYGAVNRAFAKYIGLEPKDLEGKLIRDFRDSNIVSVCITGNMEVFSNKNQYHNEEWVKSATGEERYFSVIKTPKLDENGDVEYVVCTAEDITERKRTEDKLRESETRFRTIAEQSLLGIVIIQDGLIKYANRALSAINGYSIEEMKEWGIREFQKTFEPEDLPYLMGRVQSREENRGPEIIQIPVRIITKKGRTKWLEVYSKSVLYQGKTAIFATMVDISDKKKAEESLKQSEMILREQNLELMKLDKLKDDFITIAAHELKTPLISIIGYLELILTRNEVFDPEMKEDLTRVLNNANRLQKYINQLMDVMKIDSKEISLDLKKMNVNNVIKDCVSELVFQIDRKNLKIDNYISNDLILEVDTFRISQVFSNLLSNAIKFSNPNDRIEIDLIKGDYYYLFKVKDNGVGLEKREINRLFKKFVTINQNPENFSAAERGSGLGLYITRGIIEAHGGKIWVESKGKDQGTEVNFTLPL